MSEKIISFNAEQKPQILDNDQIIRFQQIDARSTEYINL